MYKCGICKMPYRTLAERNKCEAICIARVREEQTKLSRELALKEKQESFEELEAIRLEYEMKSEAYINKYYGTKKPSDVVPLDPVTNSPE